MTVDYKPPERIQDVKVPEPEMPHIEFTADKLRTFETLYKRALAEGRDTFHFEGHPIYVGFAKYMIEYLKEYFP